MSDPSAKGADNPEDSTCRANVRKQLLLTGSASDSSEQLAEGLREAKETEKLHEEAMLREKVLELENKMANGGDVSVGAAGLMANLKGIFYL